MKKNNSTVIVCISCFLSISLILCATLTYGARSDVEAFVTRFYQQCLGRNPDQSGLNGWVNALLNGSLTGADVANGFIFSKEFINRNTTNEDFVTILYKAFFDREPDDAGYSGWLNCLYDGNSRADALNGFVSSQEFSNLCAEYGISANSSSVSGDGGESSLIFSALITDLTKVNLIQPPGSIVANGILKTHSFIQLIGKAPVYAPTDAQLYAGAYYVEENKPQYVLFFEVTSDVFFIFDHIEEPVAKIVAAFPATPKSDTRTDYINPTIQFAAGELVGYTTGTNLGRTWDFGVYNSAKPNHLNQSTPAGIQPLFSRDLIADCPYDYFTSSLRAQYRSLYASLTDDPDSYSRDFCN